MNVPMPNVHSMLQLQSDVIQDMFLLDMESFCVLRMEHGTNLCQDVKVDQDLCSLHFA